MREHYKVTPQPSAAIEVAITIAALAVFAFIGAIVALGI